MVVHTFNPNIQEAKSGGFLSLKLASELQESQDYTEKGPSIPLPPKNGTVSRSACLLSSHDWETETEGLP